MSMDYAIEYYDYAITGATTGTVVVATPGTGYRLDVDTIHLNAAISSGFVKVGYGTSAASGVDGVSVPVFYTETTGVFPYGMKKPGQRGMKAQPISIAVSGTTTGHLKIGVHKVAV